MEYGERHQRRRFVFLTALFAGTIGLLALYLFWLQIIKGFEFKQRARDVSQREMPIPAQRGEIFDRNADDPLVFNIDSFAVDVSPGEVAMDELPVLFSRLSAALGIPVSDIEKKIPPKLYRTYQAVELKSGVSLETISGIAEHLSDFKGVSWHNKPIRNYAESGSLAHVIGYVGDITHEELQVLYNQGYEPGDVLGKTGIEKEYDRILRGKDGTRFRVVDVRERQLAGGEEESVVPPEPGHNVVLTIDRRIQKLAEQALGPRNGSVVVLKPSTGEILAMVSYPSFDPNRLFGMDAGDFFGKLTLDPSFPFYNRAVQAVYPPASTFKIIMTTAIVDDGTIPINRMVRCTGKLEFGDRVFNCWVKTGHGYQDLLGGLAQSCDVYFYTMGNELGVDKIDGYARDFGLGSPTGIDLPEERTGLLPTPEWKEKVRHQKWLGGDTLNLSIGQGFVTVSPLQLADVVAMVANSGVVYRPHLLKETRDPFTGQVLSTAAPEVLHESAVSKDTWKVVQDALRGVIVKGTAAPVITTKAVEIAGKTGTSETGVEGQWHSWFAAYGPWQTDRPENRVVVVVMAEASPHWEWWAPKAANLIFQGIFANQTYDQVLATMKPWYAPVAGRVE
ncbi:MAG TPA: penicillin-binding protein 2 [Spirochaetia bacterium]|nr:penicillin-binding protein 2 [Spirochaetia bacterium]